jgi:uncharacterized repeat protein (TIGR02543 family)
MKILHKKSFKSFSIIIVILFIATIFSATVTAMTPTGPFTLDYEAGENGYLDGETYQTVEYGGNGTAVEAIPYTGYHFTDWSDGSIDNPRTDTNVTDDLYVTANFTIDTFSLNYYAGTGGSLSGEVSQTVEYETDGTAVTAVADPGYIFIDWSDGSTDNPRTDIFVTEDIDVMANFAFLYTVSFDSQGGSTVPDQMVPAGGKVDYPVAPTKTGLYFAGWYKEASCDNIWHSNIDLISANATLYAKWNDTAPKTAVLCTDSMGEDIKAKLDSTGLFSQVDVISSLDEETPTLSELKQYNSVLVFENSNYIKNPVDFGNILADYVDYGGGVVLAAFTFVNADQSIGITGRISTEDYLIFTHEAYLSSSHLTLIADSASDPILNGVNYFDGGTNSFHCNVSLSSGADLIAHWSDDEPLAAKKQFTEGRMVGLNIYPPSSDVRVDFWDSSSDGALLMANSLIWAASNKETISPPIITSDGGGNSASIIVAENQTAVTTVTATDPDSTSFTYSISGGLDANLFAIDSSSGVLTFKNAPDFESPDDYYADNIYRVAVQVSDGGLNDSQEISITVTDINEAPVITSNGGEVTANLEVKEGLTAVTVIKATDPEDDTLAFSISGLDADLFIIDSSSGILSFIAAPDFELPADTNSDGIYEVTVEVSDGTLIDTQDIIITVTLMTPVDMLNNLISDIGDLQTEGIIASSTANGLIRNINKAIDKINAGDQAGAIKILNSLITTINRQTPRKIPAIESVDLVAQIEQVIIRLNS